jgi:elongation factor P
LKENDEIKIEFYEGKPVNVIFPQHVRLKAVQAPQGIRDGADSTYKEVELENGMKVLAPQFIKEGDILVIDVETGKYYDRVKG